MKNKYLYLSVLAIGFVACGESESTETENTEHTQDVVVEETMESNLEENQEIVEDSIEVTTEFNTIESYGTLLTKDDLIAQFGKDNLKDGESWYAEGTVRMEHTILTNPNNGHIVKYLWQEDGKTLNAIEASYYLWDENFERHGTQTITSENGLKLGMSLAELKEWNGADFKFSGFGWDYAGGIFAEAGSKLYDSKVQVTLIDDQDVQSEEWRFLLGDIEFNTSDDRLKDAPILVEQFSLYVTENDGK